MDQRKYNRKGSRLYISATVSTQIASLLRYVILAHLLGPEQIGLVAAMTVSASFFDLISDTGADRFLIQDREGGTAAVQNLVQLVYVGRGILLTICLGICANPIARFYDSPQLTTGIITIAAAPLILGLLHLDVRRCQREHDFQPEAICIIATEVAGLIVTTAAAWLTLDFTAAAYGILARSAVRVAASHLLARRPYRLAWASEHAPRLARFSIPLTLNGLLLFILSQGDRVIVGREIGITALGYYSTISLMIYCPASAIASYVHSIFVPMISARRDSRIDQNRIDNHLGGLMLLLALLMAAGFAAAAPAVVPFLFGVRFAQPALPFALIGVLQAARFLLNWPSTTALAMGRSTVVLASNLAHLFIFPSVFAGIFLIGGLNGVISGFVGAELFAIAVALVLLNRAMGRGRFHGFGRFITFVLTCSAVVGWNFALRTDSWPMVSFMIMGSVALLLWLGHSERTVINAAFALTRDVIGSAMPVAVSKPGKSAP
jgi:O-antigen/teichoic acid export membrane protein